MKTPVGPPAMTLAPRIGVPLLMRSDPELALDKRETSYSVL